MKRTRLHNNLTGRWEYMTVIPVRLKTPWKCLWIWLRAFVRYAKRHNHLIPHDPPIYDFDPETLNMRDRKRERRMRRGDRRDGLLASAANALNSMIEMQRFIN